jgi:ribosomal protein L40E
MEIVILALLAILIVGAVIAPFFRGGGGHHADAAEYAVEPTSPAPRPPAAAGSPAPTATVATAPAADSSVAGEMSGEDELEAEIARYRDAIEAGTVCGRCGEANPADARFCRDCGKALPASDAQEFAT